MYAAALLGVVTLGFFGYGIVDYFRYFGRCQPVYRAELTGNDEPVDGLTVSNRNEASRVVTGAQGAMVPTEQMIWLSDVRVELCMRFSCQARCRAKGGHAVRITTGQRISWSSGSSSLVGTSPALPKDKPPFINFDPDPPP